jgi:hypothetical protein
LVTKRKDPSFTQVTSHVPKDLARRLKRYCADNDTTITDTVTLAIEEFLEKHEERFVENKPETIAQLVQQNFYQLLTDSKIKPESLKAIAAGEKPSNAALSRLANILDIREEELVSLRDREFPSKRRQPNGQPT